MSIITFTHRAGLNRRVQMGQYTLFTGGSSRWGLNSEVVTFSTRLAVQPSSVYKRNGKRSKMAAPYFCILPSDRTKWIYSSIQDQLHAFTTWRGWEKNCKTNISHYSRFIQLKYGQISIRHLFNIQLQIWNPLEGKQNPWCVLQHLVSVIFHAEFGLNLVRALKCNQ